MPRRCELGCPYTPGLTYHRFPHSVRNPDCYKDWVILVGGNLEAPDFSELYRKKVICDRHFKAEDKNRNNRLNCMAVPSLHLSGCDKESGLGSKDEQDESTSQPAPIISSKCNNVQTSQQDQKLADAHQDDTNSCDDLADAHQDDTNHCDDLEISEITVCRGCLDYNIDMYCITNTRYQKLYEKLSKSKLENGLSETFCYVCYSLLRKCMRFTDIMQQSQQILMQLQSNGDQLNAETLPNIKRPKSYLSTTTVEKLSIDSHLALADDEESVALEENLENGDEFVLEEHLDTDLDDEITEYQIVNVDNNVLEDEATTTPQETQSSFYIIEIPEKDAHKVNLAEYQLLLDPPLCDQVEVPMEDTTANTYYSSDGDEEPFEKIVNKTEDRERRLNEINMTEIFVPPQEQKEEIIRRAESDKFKTSKYKCSICYKVFINHKTCLKHAIKHNEKSGNHECDLCHYRYKTSRLLRKHILISHARLFKCNICGLEMHSISKADDHNKEHAGITFHCELCGKNLRKRTSYLSHLRIRHPNLDHICKLCGCHFINQFGLKMHYQKTHENDNETLTEVNKSKCEECDVEFLNIDALYRHRLISTRHKMLYSKTSKMCYVCEKVVETPTLNEHITEHRRMLIHHYKPPKPKSGAVISCKQCPAKFLNKSKFGQHLKQCHASGASPKNLFMCEVCGTRKFSYAALSAHQRLHTGEKPFTCPHCHKTFSDQSNLKIHYRIHTGEKPFTCDRCNHSFTQKTALNRHMRVHTGVRPYKCQICLKQFSQSNSLKVHINNVHYKQPTYRQIKKDKLKTLTDKWVSG